MTRLSHCHFTPAQGVAIKLTQGPDIYIQSKISLRQLFDLKCVVKTRRRSQSWIFGPSVIRSLGSLHTCMYVGSRDNESLISANTFAVCVCVCVCVFVSAVSIGCGN